MSDTRNRQNFPINRSQWQQSPTWRSERFCTALAARESAHSKPNQPMKTLLYLLHTLIAQPVQQFANEARAAAASLFLANQFTPDKENWVQLSPFGDFGNVDKKGARVIQRFRKEDAESICNEFNGIGRKVLQPLGMPFYVGHPDHPRFKGQPGHTDTASKGRGKQMEVRHDSACPTCTGFANSGQPCGDHGLFVQMKWNPEGEHLISNEAFHGHSVNWSAVPDGKENGVQIFRPVRVKSAGFTNEPAIPVTPASLANEEAPDPDENQPEENMTIPPKLKLIAGFKADEEVTLDQIITALEKAHQVANETHEAFEASISELGLVLLANAGKEDADGEESADHANFLKWLHEQLGTDPAAGVDALKASLEDKVTKAGHIDRVKKTRDAFAGAMKKHDDARSALEEKLANERRGSSALVVDQLVKSGHIKTADRDAKVEELVNAADFTATAAGFAAAAPIIKTASVTGRLGAMNPTLLSGARERTAKFEDLMAKREQAFPNESFSDRYQAVGSSPEGVQLIAQMQRPGAEE